MMYNIAKILRVEIGEEFLATTSYNDVALVKLTEQGIKSTDPYGLTRCCYGVLYDLLTAEGYINDRPLEPNHMTEVANLFGLKLWERFRVKAESAKNEYDMIFYEKGMMFLNLDDGYWYKGSYLYDLLLKKAKILSKSGEIMSNLRFRPEEDNIQENYYC